MEANRTTLLNRVATAVTELDPADPALPVRVKALKERAKHALGQGTWDRARSLSLDLARTAAKQARQAIGDKTRERVLPQIRTLRDEGVNSYAELARRLNELGVKPVKAKEWTRRSVQRLEESAHKTTVTPCSD